MEAELLMTATGTMAHELRNLIKWSVQTHYVRLQPCYVNKLENPLKNEPLRMDACMKTPAYKFRMQTGNLHDACITLP